MTGVVIKSYVQAGSQTGKDYNIIYDMDVRICMHVVVSFWSLFPFQRLVNKRIPVDGHKLSPHNAIPYMGQCFFATSVLRGLGNKPDVVVGMEKVPYSISGCNRLCTKPFQSFFSGSIEKEFKIQF